MPDSMLHKKPADNIQLLTYVESDMECYWTVNVIMTDKGQYD